MPNHNPERYAPKSKMLRTVIWHLFCTYLTQSGSFSEIKPPLGKAAGAQQAPLTQLEWNTDSKAKKQRRRRCLWQYGLLSFQGRDIKLARFLAKNHYTY